MLVDTSVWIDYLRGREAAHTEALDELLCVPGQAQICLYSVLEILQGITDARGQAKMERYLKSVPLLDSSDEWASHVRSAALYAKARSAGFTIRSSFDCLIAQLAIEHNIPLLHNDRDFIAIARIAPKLKHFHFIGKSQ
jgi:predicted nucleic acid-binding protein